MTFRVEVVCVGEGGEEARREVVAMERHHLTMDTLGLTLRESNAMLVGVQEFVIAHQAAEDLTQRRPCPSCGTRHTVKDGGSTAVKTFLASCRSPIRAGIDVRAKGMARRRFGRRRRGWSARPVRNCYTWRRSGRR